MTKLKSLLLTPITHDHTTDMLASLEAAKNAVISGQATGLLIAISVQQHMDWRLVGSHHRELLEIVGRDTLAAYLENREEQMRKMERPN